MNALLELKRFTCFVVRRFNKDDCTYRASALAFTTILALVPLMAVGLSILSSFPAFRDWSVPVQDFIFSHFVPATGKVVQSYLQQFTAQISKLSIFGVSFLFVTALLLMHTIEASMNKIWRVKKARTGVSAFLLYWTILSLSPFLVGLSLAITSYFLSSSWIQGHTPPYLLQTGLPFLLSFIGFSALYFIVPNCRVHWLHGLTGAAVATLLFELAKHGFAAYLNRYNSYQLLYGAFATIPIFFLWVYWVWLITLLGVEISYALSVYHKIALNSKQTHNK